MKLAKQIFNIYLPFTSWSVFLETVGLAGVLISALGIWIAWSSEKRSAATRKEEQKTLVFESFEEKQLRQEALILTLKEAITFIKESLDEVKSDIGRLTAQVGQIETETILKRKMAHLEERFYELQKKVDS